MLTGEPYRCYSVHWPASNGTQQVGATTEAMQSVKTLLPVHRLELGGELVAHMLDITEVTSVDTGLS